MRAEIQKEAIKQALIRINIRTESVLKEKGSASFSSSHEILGVITEEYNELIEAVHKNDQQLLLYELLDLATACQFAIACINERTLDW